ncbi:hypothetical protein FIA58_017780 [Flavobacterium jejuense]|uniref:HTH cro/C1-type domain-containing protein n=1 Tax=Flavobacterium jejuense TaxID=1544455 RepID=A0ABX0IUZ9_9FLAO|nr:hypothetical protein [Flavobacterium jejuense]NHN27533.1 hypothetical protein [Flavobacterium jejuense]
MKKGRNNISTGKLLSDFISKNKIKKSTLGKTINRDGVSILKYTQNSSIQTGILIELCYALQHNFFQDIANQLPDTFSVNEHKKEEIATLKEEIKVLQIQNELLMKLKS